VTVAGTFLNPPDPGAQAARQSGDVRAGAVVVFYHPDNACISRANRIAAMLPLIAVDNTPGSTAGSPPAGLGAAVTYLPNGANLGIAEALNQGIEMLRGRKADYALLFDQDSEPSRELLDGLLVAMDDLVKAGDRVAVVGPAYDDARLGGTAPFVRFDAWRMTRVPPVGSRPIEAGFLISSGSCVNLSVWPAVGPMDATLFIDFVDVEWCVRARRAGYAVLGLPWLKMPHHLGDAPVSVLGRTFAMHSAVRHYFLFRNAVALVFYRGYMPRSWKIAELAKFPVRAMIYILLSGRPLEQVRMIARGCLDGVRNRMGPLH
jgi:rhamnosyltransferase